MPFPTFLNRPFSPHLTVYAFQLSSFVSISHRLIAILLLFLLFITFFIYSQILNFWFYKYLIFNKVIFILIYFLFCFSIKLSIFHFLNGIRIIFFNLTNLHKYFWNLNFIYLIFFFIFCSILFW
nr:Succinate dehydrogenase subunit 3 [Polysiphonia sp.]